MTTWFSWRSVRASDALGLVVVVLDLITSQAPLAAVIMCMIFVEQGVLGGLTVSLLPPLPAARKPLLHPVIYGGPCSSPRLSSRDGTDGAELAGVLGALMAIPVAGSIQAIVRELLLAHRERLIETPPGAAVAAPNDSS